MTAGPPRPSDYLSCRFSPTDPELASSYDELALWSARFGLLLLEELPLRPGRTILDLGCGTGFPLFELARLCGSSGRFVGVDVWASGLERAARKGRFHKLPHVALTLADGARLPFAAGAFDLVVSNLGVNNFDDPAAVFSEVARILPADGQLALTTNARGHLREFYAVFREVIGKRGRPDWLARLEANEAHRLDEADLRRVLAAAGLRVTRSVTREVVLRYLDGSSFFRHPLTWMGFLEGWRTVIEPAAEEDVFGETERRLNDLAAREGHLRMTVPALYLEASKSGGAFASRRR